MPDPSVPQQARAAKTRAKLLDAAAVVVRREGVAAMTLARVADEAGVSKGGLLHHFGSKEELLAGLLEQTMADAAASLNAMTDGDDRGSFARAYLEYVRRPDEHQADSATAIFAAAAAGDGELGAAVEVFEAWQHRLMHDDGLDPALGLLARIVGDGLWLIDLFGLARPSAADRAAVIDLVARLLDDPIQ
ncbi:MAG: TetR/AcrR family transcriptional regulator [Actinomycetota bacterium]